MKRSMVYGLVMTLAGLPTALVGQWNTPPAPVPSTRSVQEVLLALRGRWHFDVYSRGHTLPVASGQRDMRLLADSTKLAWTETPNDLPQVAPSGTSFLGYFTAPNAPQSQSGSGLLGYNGATGAWYVLGAYTHEPNPLVLIGRADRSGRTLTFDPLESTAQPGIFISSELRLVDADHFEWVASDGRWRAVFTRTDHS